jgi:hypothetical protein
MAKKKWMKEAFANSHGQFKAKAEHAGKSTAEFAKEHEHDKGKTGQQARLAEVGMNASHKKSRKAKLYDKGK